MSPEGRSLVTLKCARLASLITGKSLAELRTFQRKMLVTPFVAAASPSPAAGRRQLRNAANAGLMPIYVLSSIVVAGKVCVWPKLPLFITALQHLVHVVPCLYACKTHGTFGMRQGGRRCIRRALLLCFIMLYLFLLLDVPGVFRLKG